MKDGRATKTRNCCPFTPRGHRFPNSPHIFGASHLPFARALRSCRPSRSRRPRSRWCVHSHRQLSLRTYPASRLSSRSRLRRLGDQDAFSPLWLASLLRRSINLPFFSCRARIEAETTIEISFGSPLQRPMPEDRKADLPPCHSRTGCGARFPARSHATRFAPRCLRILSRARRALSALRRLATPFRLEPLSLGMLPRVCDLLRPHSQCTGGTVVAGTGLFLRISTPEFGGYTGVAVDDAEQ